MFPRNVLLTCYPPVSQDATLFGTGSLQMQRVKMRASWNREGPESTGTGVLTPREKVDTDMHSKEISCEDEAGGHSDVSTAHRRWAKPDAGGGGAWTVFALTTPEETSSAHAWSRLLLGFCQNGGTTRWLCRPHAVEMLQQPREIRQGSLRKHCPSRDPNKKNPGKSQGKGVPRKEENQCGTPSRGCTEWISGRGWARRGGHL